jgi:hypothetical protein
MKMSLRKAAITTAAVAAAGGLAFGATSAFAASPSPSTTPTASTGAAGPHIKAGHAKAGKARRATVRRDLRARFKDGAHGQNTLMNKDGQPVEHEWQVGTVQSVSGQEVTVTDSSGTTWTWTLASGARVRVDGKAGGISGIKAGDKIAVLGVRSGSANDARQVLDPNQADISGHAG